MLSGLAAYIGARKNSESIDKLLPFLRANVIAAILTPVFLGFSLIYA